MLPVPPPLADDSRVGVIDLLEQESSPVRRPNVDGCREGSSSCAVGRCAWRVATYGGQAPIVRRRVL